MIALKIMYTANIIVAGWISITSLFYPKKALITVFENSIAYSEAIRLIGSLWGAIFILSVFGLFYPKKMALVLLFQLIYKGSWVFFVMLPSIMNKQVYPKGMGIFFVVWCILLPFIIPWKYIFSTT
ncbi:hypothetical protein [Costertonia aggregata]|uniref:Uncharacterized protein n=1 Tax=Costertonia aggregata TaxID=343403 RepID=A0A7H9AP48_9FLAO|nr:hypothetical protein [Costertonia aggregata]QLG45218.1 hypothetical protein HYG79_07605 [Costertonia aggregata]